MQLTHLVLFWRNSNTVTVFFVYFLIIFFFVRLLKLLIWNWNVVVGCAGARSISRAVRREPRSKALRHGNKASLAEASGSLPVDFGINPHKVNENGMTLYKRVLWGFCHLCWFSWRRSQLEVGLIERLSRRKHSNSHDILSKEVECYKNE